MSLLASPFAPAEPLELPTLIYQTNIVPLSLPRNASGPIASVILKKMTGPNAGQARPQEVTGDTIFFRSLSSGAYEVYYFRATSAGNHAASYQGSTSPDRRLLIEGQDSAAAKLIALAATEPTAPPAEACVFPPYRVAEGVETEMAFVANKDVLAAEGWRLLRASSLFNARRSFIETIAKGAGGDNLIPALETADGRVLTVQQVLEAIPEVTVALRGLAIEERALAERLAAHVRHSALLAPCFYGLGKTYEQIGRETPQLLADSEQLAVVCLLTATMLEPNLQEAVNDFACLCASRGEWPRAITALSWLASRSSQATIAYNLGVALMHAGREMEALEWWRWVAKAHPGFRPAHRDLIRAAFRKQAPALYAGQACRLRENIKQLYEEQRAALLHPWLHEAYQMTEVFERENTKGQPPATKTDSVPPPSALTAASQPMPHPHGPQSLGVPQ